MNFLKSLLGGIVIMAAATLIGVAQNAARSKPVALFPRLSTPADVVTQPVSGGDSARGGTATGPEVTAAEYGTGELVMERVKAIVESGTAVVIDARGADEYAEGHIPGAINIPYDEFIEYYDTIVNDVPLDSPVIVYCRSVTCDLSDNLARELKLMGYGKVVLYRGGWLEWTEAGHPAVTGLDPH